jgi:hypothetical protein
MLADFSKGAPSLIKVTLDKDTYTIGEPIGVAFARSDATNADWLVISNQTWNSSCNDVCIDLVSPTPALNTSYTWQYLCGGYNGVALYAGCSSIITSGNVTFVNGLDVPGTYNIYYAGNNLWPILWTSAPFTVIANPSETPSAVPTSAVPSTAMPTQTPTVPTFTPIEAPSAIPTFTPSSAVPTFTPSSETPSAVPSTAMPTVIPPSSEGNLILKLMKRREEDGSVSDWQTCPVGFSSSNALSLINSVAKASTDLQFDFIKTLDSICDNSVESSSRRRAQSDVYRYFVVYGISFSTKNIYSHLGITDLDYLIFIQDAFYGAIYDGLFDTLLHNETYITASTKFLLDATLTGVEIGSGDLNALFEFFNFSNSTQEEPVFEFFNFSNSTQEEPTEEPTQELTEEPTEEPTEDAMHEPAVEPTHIESALLPTLTPALMIHSASQSPSIAANPNPNPNPVHVAHTPVSVPVPVPTVRPHTDAVGPTFVMRAMMVFTEANVHSLDQVQRTTLSLALVNALYLPQGSVAVMDTRRRLQQTMQKKTPTLYTLVVPITITMSAQEVPDAYMNNYDEYSQYLGEELMSETFVLELKAQLLSADLDFGFPDWLGQEKRLDFQSLEILLSADNVIGQPTIAPTTDDGASDTDSSLSSSSSSSSSNEGLLIGLMTMVLLITAATATALFYYYYKQKPNKDTHEENVHGGDNIVTVGGL